MTSLAVAGTESQINWIEEYLLNDFIILSFSTMPMYMQPAGITSSLN